MANVDAPTLSATSIPEDFPETVETFADVLKALGLTELNVDQRTQTLAIRGTSRMIKEYGLGWIRENRVRLVEELELINEM